MKYFSAKVTLFFSGHILWLQSGFAPLLPASFSRKSHFHTNDEIVSILDPYKCWSSSDKNFLGLIVLNYPSHAVETFSVLCGNKFQHPTFGLFLSSFSHYLFLDHMKKKQQWDSFVPNTSKPVQNRIPRKNNSEKKNSSLLFCNYLENTSTKQWRNSFFHCCLSGNPILYKYIPP